MNLFERICLHFIKEQRTKDMTGLVTVFKVFKGKKYIIGQFYMPPNHYNCRTRLTPKGCNHE